MALTKTPIELSSTPSIVDGGNATAITIDSSERVLIGKTGTGLGTSGTEINPNGYVQITEDQSPPLYLNRLTTDGSIINFYKDGTTVGSIGAGSGSLFIGNTSQSSGISFYGTALYPNSGGSISATNGANDLGAPTARWKDLYLSGGAYLGGTAAANKLEDYEEGTHNTTVSFSNSGSATVISNTLAYTKIGNAVIVTGYVAFNGISSPSGILRFTLPFPVASGTHYRSSADCKFNTLNTGYNINETPWALVEDNASTVAVYGGQSTSVNFVMGAACTATTDFRVSVCYITSA